MVLNPRPVRQQLAAAATQLRLVGGNMRPQRVHAVVLTALASASAESKTPCRKAVPLTLPLRSPLAVLPRQRMAETGPEYRFHGRAARRGGETPLSCWGAANGGGSGALHPEEALTSHAAARRGERQMMICMVAMACILCGELALTIRSLRLSGAWPAAKRHELEMPPWSPMLHERRYTATGLLEATLTHIMDAVAARMVAKGRRKATALV